MTDSNPLPVSVILPVYNGGRFLRLAIESVLAQEQARLELIVVDGASTDDTEAIATSFGDRIRYFRTGRDTQPSAMNFGIGNALHPLIAFTAGDDLWLPRKIEKQVQWLAANPGAEIAYCRLRGVLHEGHQWPANVPDLLRGVERDALIPEAMLCRREMFESNRVGPFDPVCKTAFDVDWFARMCDTGGIFGVVPEVLLLKGVHDANSWLATKGVHSNIMRALHRSIRRKNEK